MSMHGNGKLGEKREKIADDDRGGHIIASSSPLYRKSALKILSNVP
jgi:hypothetical protein